MAFEGDYEGDYEGETYDEIQPFTDYEEGATNYLQDREVPADYSQFLAIQPHTPAPDSFVNMGMRIDGRQPYNVFSQGYLQLDKPNRLLDENKQNIVFS